MKIEIMDDLRYRHENGRVLPMGHRELYQALGLDPKRHLPKEGVAARTIGNVTVSVDPKIEGKAQDAARVWCSCPRCGKYLTAGKLHQHMKVHR